MTPSDGGSGRDFVRGGLGDDSIQGGGGFAGRRGDILHANAGNDTVVGGGGFDLITGNAGIDNLNGGPGCDRIFAGPDDDTVDGGAGFSFNRFRCERLHGGAGNDTAERRCRARLHVRRAGRRRPDRSRGRGQAVRQAPAATSRTAATATTSSGR